MAALTERQDKIRKITKGIIKLLLCPIWIPIVLLQQLASNIDFFLEYLVLGNGDDIIDNFAEWLARLFDKKI